MSDPLRLRDDPATPNGQKRLLRNEPAPDVGYDVERGLSRFRQAIEPGSMVRRRSRAKAAAAVLSSVWLWIALPAAATGVWVVQRVTATRQDVGASLHEARAASAPRASAPHMARAPRAASELSEPAPAVPAPDASEVPATAAPNKRAAPEARDSQLLAETAHMAELRRLAATDPARALGQAEQGARQFPRGFFAQEREAMSITLLLRLGRSEEARARGERFLARHPQGPAAEQIRRAIGRD